MKDEDEKDKKGEEGKDDEDFEDIFLLQAQAMLPENAEEAFNQFLQKKVMEIEEFKEQKETLIFL